MSDPSMDDVNRQHLANAGLDPAMLGQPVTQQKAAEPEDRCTAVHPETGSRCALADGHHYDMHIRGRERWSAYAEPTRAPGNREGDQVLPTGDLSIEDDQERIAASLHQLADDLLERRRLGIQRYGQGHRPFNGRNTIQDAYDEGVDQTVYLGSLLRARDAHREELFDVVARTLSDNCQPGTYTTTVPNIAAAVVDRILDYVTVKIEEGQHAVG